MVYRTCAVAATALLAAGIATAAPPKVVTLPNSDAQCFAPWAAFSNTNTREFVSSRVGCYTFQPILGAIDLATACLKK